MKPIYNYFTKYFYSREHQSKHHGHSHTHGHVHSPPESLSAVVWMVILGDGKKLTLVKNISKTFCFRPA